MAILSFGFLIIPVKKRFSFWGFLLFFITGLTVVIDTLLLAEVLLPDDIILISYPLEYLIGPLLYFFLVNLLYPKPSSVIQRKHYLLFSLPLFVAAVAALLFSPMGESARPVWWDIEKLIYYGIEIWTLGCILLFLIPFLLTVRRGGGFGSTNSGIYIIFSILWSLWLILYILIIFLDYSFLEGMMNLWGSGLALLISFYHIRKPEILGNFRESADRGAPEKYQKSSLAAVDRDEVIKELTLLMEVKRTYLDPELTLSTLSRRLGLRTHQLSELLNTGFEKSFSSYINEYRIAHACCLLKEQPSMQILEIGISSGFQSKSSFNSIFKKVTGTTPGKYRRNGKPAEPAL